MQTRILIPILALVIALAVLASAIAMWYDTLKIHAEIKTGEVDVVFDKIRFEEGDEYGKPWVASCTAKLDKHEDEDNSNPSGDDDRDLIIEIDNAYPGYSCTIYFKVINTGTIPVKGAYRRVDTDFGKFPAFEELDLDGDEKNDIEVYYSLGPVQIEPDDSKEFSITIKVLQDSPEDTTLVLQLHLYFIQWNEAPAE